MTAEQHAPDDLCFYCASDTELARAVAGLPHRTIRMDGTTEECPVWTPRPPALSGPVSTTEED